MQYSTFERLILTTIAYRTVTRNFFSWTSSKKQGLDQKKKKSPPITCMINTIPY